MGWFIFLALYALGVLVAEMLYRIGNYNEDHDVVLWSWIGVFAILLSLSNR